VRAYVINLARSPERRRHIAAELARTDLAYEIVAAVDGRDLDLSDPQIVDCALLAKNDFPAGTAGCALSHLRAYRRILGDGGDAGLVLEDDVTLPADLGRLADEVARHLTGAEVALLNYGSADTCLMSREGTVDLASSRLLAMPINLCRLVNAGAYVITREACERMVRDALPIRANADDWTYFYTHGLVDRVRCVLPLPVGKSEKFESTIGLYSLGDSLTARVIGPLVRHRIPVVHRVVRARRRRILSRWERSDIVDAPFVQRPSRLG